jgi:hypothetical protein
VHNRFGNEKTSRQFVVVAGRAHRRGQSLAANANFERFLDREVIPQILERTVLSSPDDSSRTDARRFFHQ